MPNLAVQLLRPFASLQMETHEIVKMELKKDTDAATGDHREIIKPDQIGGEVVVETSENIGQPVEQEQRNQVVANHHHQLRNLTRHPPAPLPQPPKTGQVHGTPEPPPPTHHVHPLEHAPGSRPTQIQLWSTKDDEGDRVGIASAAQPITVITTPKTRMINSSESIR